MGGRQLRRIALIVGFGCGVWAQPLTLLEALRRTLTTHPMVQVYEQDVARQQALHMQATGQFDTVLGSRLGESRLNSALFGVAQRAVSGGAGIAFGYTEASATATRQLRNGLTVSPVIEVSRQSGIAGGPAVHTERAGFTVTMPLLRGRGRHATAAEERATEIEAAAAADQLQFRLTELLSETAAAYWEHTAAVQLLEVLLASEQRGQAYLENVRTLVAADKVPRVELSQVEANLAARSANRAAGQQRLAEARGRLAMTQGLTEAGAAKTDALPATALHEQGLGDLVRNSVGRRTDLQALRKLIDSAEVRRRAAESQVKPALSLSAGAGYSSLQSNAAAYRSGDLSAALTYEFLPSNHLRRGKLDEASAQLRRESARVAEAERQVRISVQTYWNALTAASERCRQTRSAVGQFTAALEGEREKYRLGVGSIVDLLTVEDRLTAASANAVDADANFAASLARLALASGAVMQGGVVTAEPFLAVPR
jgi:outer membrane protein TolC